MTKKLLDVNSKQLKAMYNHYKKLFSIVVPARNKTKFLRRKLYNKSKKHNLDLLTDEDANTVKMLLPNL